MGILGDIWEGTKSVGSGVSDTINPFDKDFQRKVGNIWDDVTGVTAAEGAAEAQREGLDKAQAWQEKMYDKAMETQKPWLEAGERGLASLEAGLDSGAFEYDPGEFQFDFEADPGYQFRLEEGMKALEGSAAARGGLFSGETGKSLQQYGQNLASQEYGQAYNRARGEYMDDFNIGRSLGADKYNRLAALSGTGQITAGNVGQQSIAQGGNLANIALQRGNVGAQRSLAGYQGGMNLFNTGLQAIGTVGGMMGPKKAPGAGG